MIYKLTFTEKWRCFEAGDFVEFHPGVNLLVGDQGWGKSSLLQAIAAVGKAKKYTYPSDVAKKVTIDATPTQCGGFDLERDNPRTRGYFDDNIKGHIAALFSSHGQANMALLRGIADFSDMLIFLDEPDMALSIRSIGELVTLFRNAASRGCQIIAAVHNPLLIESFPEVYSLRDGWIPGGEFVKSQLDKWEK